MSVYNREKYLCEAIESVLNQTFKDFEFIIIDDASTDGTSRLLKEYSKIDNRIILISNKNAKVIPVLLKKTKIIKAMHSLKNILQSIK